jgi:hypothetical protein
MTLRVLPTAKRGHVIHDRLCRRSVGCQRDLMHVADPHQSRNVRLVRLGGQRIAEKEDRPNFAFRHAAANDLIATVRPVGYGFNVQAEFAPQHLSCMTGSDELLPLKEIQAAANEVENIGFLFVVGDQRNHFGLSISG